MSTHPAFHRPVYLKRSYWIGSLAQGLLTSSMLVLAWVVWAHDNFRPFSLVFWLITAGVLGCAWWCFKPVPKLMELSRFVSLEGPAPYLNVSALGISVGEEAPVSWGHVESVHLDAKSFGHISRQDLVLTRMPHSSMASSDTVRICLDSLDSELSPEEWVYFIDEEVARAAPKEGSPLSDVEA